MPALRHSLREPGTSGGGLHDGKQGVQWNIGFDPRLPERWVGVNLEGLRYDGWPLARLIKREALRPTLPTLVTRHAQVAVVRMLMGREFWIGRNRVHQESIADIPLSSLNEIEWRQVLAGARTCVASTSGGRAPAHYNPKTGGEPIAAEVTPHLAFRITSDAVDDWYRFIRDAVDQLDPLYDWAVERSAA